MGLTTVAQHDWLGQECGSGPNGKLKAKSFTQTNMMAYEQESLGCGDERAWLLEFPKSNNLKSEHSK
jgi:hypothetical protein